MQNFPLSKQLVLLDEVIEESRDLQINAFDFNYHSKLYQLFYAIKEQSQDAFIDAQCFSDSLRVLEKFLVLVKRFPNHPLESETQSLIDFVRVQEEHRKFFLTIKEYLQKASIDTLYDEIIRVREYRKNLRKESKIFDSFLKAYASKLAIRLQTNKETNNA